MTSNGLQHNPPSGAEVAALDSGMASINSQSGDADPAALQSTMASTNLEPATEAESPATTMRTPASLLALPSELRLRIFKFLGMITRNVIDVDTSYTVYKTGSRTSVLSRSSAFRDSPDALNIVKTNKQLLYKVTSFLYANTVFKIASLPAFAMFVDEIGPTLQNILTTVELNLGIPDDDDVDEIDVYGILQNLTNLETFTVAIDSHVLDVVAAQDEDLRSRFATQLSPPGGHWWSEESAYLARQHMNFLRQFSWGLLGQAGDEAGRREKFKILKITTWMGPSARQRAAMMSQHRSVLQSDDYDEIKDIILPRIELELEADGWFA